MAVLARGVRLRHAMTPVFLAGLVAVSLRAAEARDIGPRAVHAHVDSSAVAALRPIEDSLRGRSGKLRVRLLGQSTLSFAIPLLQRLFGDTVAVEQPGVHPVSDSVLSGSFSFITLRPFADKVGSKLGQYLLGFWPSERGRTKSAAYENPEGFIEVTEENQNTQVSEHFRLRDFLTHDQHDVWPKYLVLREDLIDKLELVIDDLQQHGIRVEHMSVLSGFRTPHYNRRGGETGGRAGLSRHMYGDAADVFVDNDQDGRMDDLNHDRRIDWRDARVVQQAVERVEAAHPDLLGGVGVYRATRSHGPFAHVDVRGWRARWGRAG